MQILHPKATRATGNQWKCSEASQAFCFIGNLQVQYSTGSLSWIDTYGIQYAMPVSMFREVYMHSYAYCRESGSLPYMTRERERTHTQDSFLRVLHQWCREKKKISYKKFASTFSLTTKGKTYFSTADILDFSLQERHRCN